MTSEGRVSLRGTVQAPPLVLPGPLNDRPVSRGTPDDPSHVTPLTRLGATASHAR